MKKLALCLILILSFAASHAQICMNPGSYCLQWNRGLFIYSLGIPARSGAPSGQPASPDKHSGFVVYDSTGNRFYVYDGSSTWIGLLNTNDSGTSGAGKFVTPTGVSTIGNATYLSKVPTVNIDNTGLTASTNIFKITGAASQTGSFMQFINGSGATVLDFKSVSTGNNPTYVYGDATNGTVALNSTYNTSGSATVAYANRNSQADVAQQTLIHRQTWYEYFTGGIKQFYAMDAIAMATGLNTRQGYLAFTGGDGTTFGNRTLILGKSSHTTYLPIKMKYVTFGASTYDIDEAVSAKFYIDLTASGAQNADTAFTIQSDATPTGSAINILKKGTGRVFAVDFNGAVASGGVTAASAQMTVTSTTKGFLPPRMTGAQAEAISSPAEGLMVYSTDGSGATITSKGWWGYDGAVWVKLN